MTKQTITIKVFGDGEQPDLVTVEAEIVGQLAIHPCRVNEGWCKNRFTVTHIASGRSVGRFYRSHKAAKQFAEFHTWFDFDEHWRRLEAGEPLDPAAPKVGQAIKRRGGE